MEYIRFEYVPRANAIGQMKFRDTQKDGLVRLYDRMSPSGLSNYVLVVAIDEREKGPVRTQPESTELD